MKLWREVTLGKGHTWRYKRKLQDHHLAGLRELIAARSATNNSVKSFREQLLLMFPDLQDVSLSTVRRALKDELHCRYKKIETEKKAGASAASGPARLQSSLFLAALLQKGYRVVTIDETALH